MYCVVDYIGIESASDIDYFVKNTLKKKIKIEVLDNWSAPIEPIDSELESNILDKTKINIVYGGNMGDAQDLLSLMRYFDKSILNERVVLTLIGSGSQFNKINEIY